MVSRRFSAYVLATLSAGCSGEPTPATPALATAAAPAPVVTKPGPARPGPKEVDALVHEGERTARNGDPGAAVRALDQALSADPANRAALRLLSLALNSQAGQLERPHNSTLFLRSAGAMRTLLAQTSKPTEEEKLAAAVAFYNEACTFALNGETGRAIRSLAEACAAGFDQPGTLDADHEMDTLRNLPEFQPLRARVERRYAEALVARTKPFPFDFRLKDPDGTSLALSDFKGSVTVVNFWGTWCTACRKTLPHLAELSRRYKSRGVQVLGITYENETGDPARKRVRTFVKDAGIPYPCLIGDEATQRQVPGFNGYPTTLFLDREGKVRAQVTGYQPLAAMEAIVETIRGEVQARHEPARNETATPRSSERAGTSRR